MKTKRHAAMIPHGVSIRLHACKRIYPHPCTPAPSSSPPPRWRLIKKPFLARGYTVLSTLIILLSASVYYTSSSLISTSLPTCCLPMAGIESGGGALRDVKYYNYTRLQQFKMLNISREYVTLTGITLVHVYCRITKRRWDLTRAYRSF